MSVLMIFLMAYAAMWVVLAWTDRTEGRAAVTDSRFATRAPAFETDRMRTAA